MHIGWKNIERTYKLASVEGIIGLAEVDDEPDLGVNNQSNLQLDKHITTVCVATNRTVGITKHAFSRISVGMFSILFY